MLGALQMAPIPSVAAGPSSLPSGDDSDLVQRLRSKISQMEKDLSIIHAGVVVAKKNGELAIATEKYARDELIKATQSLHCE